LRLRSSGEMILDTPNFKGLNAADPEYIQETVNMRNNLIFGNKLPGSEFEVMIKRSRDFNKWSRDRIRLQLICHKLIGSIVCRDVLETILHHTVANLKYRREGENQFSLYMKASTILSDIK